MTRKNAVFADEQVPPLQVGARVTNPRHLDYGEGVLIKQALKDGAEAWHVQWQQHETKRSKATLAAHLQPVIMDKGTQVQPSRVGQGVRCVHGLHIHRQGIIQQGGPQLVQVQYDGLASALWVQPSSLHVIADSQGGASLTTAWPKEPVRRLQLPKAHLRSWLREYSADEQYPTDLQLLQPGSDLALQFALGELSFEQAGHMYLGCLKGVARCFNVTDSAAVAAAAEGLAPLVPETAKQVSNSAQRLGNSLRSCATIRMHRSVYAVSGIQRNQAAFIWPVHHVCLLP